MFDPTSPCPAPAHSHRQTPALAMSAGHRRHSRHTSRQLAQRAKHDSHNRAAKGHARATTSSAVTFESGTRRQQAQHEQLRQHRQPCQQEQRQHQASRPLRPGPLLTATAAVKPKQEHPGSREPRPQEADPGCLSRHHTSRILQHSNAGEAADHSSVPSGATVTDDDVEDQHSVAELTMHATAHSTHAASSSARASPKATASRQRAQHRQHGLSEEMHSQPDTAHSSGSDWHSSDGQLSRQSCVKPSRSHRAPGVSAAEKPDRQALLHVSDDRRHVKDQQPCASLANDNSASTGTSWQQHGSGDLQRPHVHEGHQRLQPHRLRKHSGTAAAAASEQRDPVLAADHNASALQQQQDPPLPGVGTVEAAPHQQLPAEAQLPVQALMAALQNMLKLGIVGAMPNTPAVDPPQHLQHPAGVNTDAVLAVTEQQTVTDAPATLQPLQAVPLLQQGMVSGQCTDEVGLSAAQQQQQQQQEPDVIQARHAVGSMAYSLMGMPNRFTWQDR